MAKKKTQATKKKKNIKLSFGRLYVQTSVNNTMVTLTDETGNKISGWGTWLVGFKWTKESTPYAAEMLARDVLKEAKENFWLKEIWVFVKWIGLGRDGVFKAINDLWGIDIMYIKDQTPLQFWGCKWKRPKRN